MKCRAVIIGSDHTNTLSLIRDLGRNKIPFVLIMHSEDRHLCANSRYVRKNYVFVAQTKEAIMGALRKIRSKAEHKPVILCATDIAQYTVDFYLKELENDFYCFAFHHEEKKICRMMDKYEQYLFACRHGIKMAKTWKIKLEQDKMLPEDMEYPVIVKPAISAFGAKTDIAKADDEKALLGIIQRFKQKGYTEVLLQKYIENKSEFTALGCVFSKEIDNIVVWLKKIHIYPVVGGSISYAQNRTSIPKEALHVVRTLQEEGYAGLYDLDFFYADGGYMLNEINFRNSGVNYALKPHGINTAYQWYLYCNGEDITPFEKKALKEKYNFAIYMQLCLLQKKEIGFFTFVKEFCKASSYSIFAWDDLKPLLKMIMNVAFIRERFQS